MLDALRDKLTEGMRLDEIERLLTQSPVSVHHPKYVSPYSSYTVEAYDEEECELPWSEYAWNGRDVVVTVPGLGTVQTIHQHGGEGLGDYAYAVIEVTEDDGTVRLFKKEGYHSSYDGTYYDGDFREVQRKQKTIEVFE